MQIATSVTASRVYVKEVVGVDKITLSDTSDLISTIRSLETKMTILENRLAKFSSLTDVNLDNLEDGNVVIWSSVEKKWVPASIE